ncbi:hypothetical protein [Oscillatoria sp. FACHB-1406]|uniref:hypothetical protein n=1 Tax=Oscillatoria sp. FACHB-1406 TaxID=2692846 RepID=UPI001684A749|nr:hypothetical protein [Oscillatoria sp. FACHB-1406]MBD2576877.1 hypothetical protein [Oscillatoria sp. FACHB-1406]
MFFLTTLGLSVALNPVASDGAIAALPHEDSRESYFVPARDRVEPLPEIKFAPAIAQNPPESESETPPSDPELGTLRLEELPKPQPQAEANAYLLGWIGYSRSSNVFAEVDPIDDGLFRANLTFLTLQKVTPTTTLFASIGGSTNRYQQQYDYDYKGLNFNAGVSQTVFDRTEVELGWENQQLFAREGGDRFLNSHTLYGQLRRRDPLAARLNLDTSYLLRFSFAEPDSRSQTLHSLRTALNYTPYQALELGLEYEFVYTDFTRIERSDRYHELLARLSYQLSPHSQIELFGGRSFGGSSDPNIDFNNFIFGVGFGFTLF